MSPQTFFIFCLLISSSFYLTAATNTANAATYYLDAVNGDDTTGDGSSSVPWRTIAKAEASAVNGSVIYLRSGNYGEVSINRTGLNRSSWDDGITFQPALGENPVFDRLGITGFENRYLIFKNINITAPSDSTFDSVVVLKDSSHIKIIDCNITGRWNPEGTNLTKPIVLIDSTRNTSKYTTDILINGCDIQQGYWGVQIYHDSRNIIVRNSHIHWTSSSFFSIDRSGGSTGEVIIENNHLHDRRKTPGAHGSGIAIRTNDLIIRGNKIHDYGGSGGIVFYGDSLPPGGGYENITIENNLVYDSQGTNQNKFNSIKGNITVRNNTFISWHWSSGGSGVYRYGGNAVAQFAPADDTIGADDVFVYNNIFVGYVGVSSNIRNFNEDNNIFWSFAHWGAGDFLDQPLGSNSIIIRGGSGFNPGYDESYFEGSGNFFVGGADFDTYSYTRGPEGYSHKQNLNDAYKLAFGSDAIGFADPLTATKTDLLGNLRDAQPDAGCYEYVLSDPNNSAPVLAAIGDKSVSENSLLSFTVNATDADGDTITYSAQNLPSGATFSSQTFSWTPTYGQASSYQVTFIASDGQAQDSETITITVNNVNRAPVLAAIGNKSVNENSLLTFTANATDPDGDTITYSVDGLPSGAVFASRTFTWTPGYNQAGTYQVTFTASDSQAQDSEIITITVSNVNRAPAISTIGDKSVYATDLLTFTVNATDPDGDTIAYSVDSLPSGAIFVSQSFSWTPGHSQAGSYPVTFIASDSQLQDSEPITITVNAADTSAPTVTNCSPAADSIQIPLNSLIILHIADTGEGVDANSVTIQVNNNTVHSGNTAHYISQYGDCRRTGTKADYTFTYQPNEMFDFDRTISVTVNAIDLADNAMAEYSYSFSTEMRSFGKNKKVNSGSDNLSKGRPVTVRDSSGNIWVAWHAGPANSRDIYVGKLVAGADNFGSSAQLTSNANGQLNPAIAVGSDDKLYVVWQDNRRGNWDIYISTSVDGINWSAERRVTDSNDNQTNPAIVIDGLSPNRGHIVWQDDRGGNQDIYIANSSNGFTTKTVSQITSHSSDQVEPAIAVGSDNTIYVVWTDGRGGSNNIYGAASNNGPWTNVPIVSNANNQSSPAIATEAVGAVLHLLWVDDTSGNRNIYYAASDGLPISPLSGNNIIVDSSGADQLAPVIMTVGSTGDGLKVFACWQDKRNVASGSGDTDLYFADLSPGQGTNVLVGDDSTNANQDEPAIGINVHSHPYLVWTDGRSTNAEIYYAGSTFVESDALASEDVSASLGATVGTEPGIISAVDDVSVIVPAGAYPCDMKITISRIKNPQPFALQCLGSYDFGPSGIEFSLPVTVTIPYNVSGSGGSALAYWYNSLTGALSQQGITDVEDIVISPTLHALSFKTTHFTAFYLLLGGGAVAAGGGGGCAISATGEGNIVEFLLPYIGLALVMVILRLRDVQKQKARNITKSEC